MKIPWVRSQSGNLYNLNHFVFIKAVQMDDTVAILGYYTDSGEVKLGVYLNKQAAIQVMDWVRFWRGNEENVALFTFPDYKEVVINHD